MTFFATWLISKGLSSRLAKALEWALAAIVALTVIAGVWIAVAHHHDSYIANVQQDAITAHDKDITIEAANIVMAADRSATANQADRDAAFDNTQAQAKDAVNEAQRTRTSPLDAAFGKLR